jgi:hypothetical protein
MIPNIDITQLYRLEHGHADGSRHPMEIEHHDPAQHDPERSWGRAKVFRCVKCNETIALLPREEG